MTDIKIPEPEKVPVAKLKTDGDNPNEMTQKQLKALTKNIERYGFIIPIITNKNLLIADGEHRLKASKKLGMKNVPVVRLDIDTVDRKILRQVLNKLRGTHQEDKDEEEIQRIINADREEDLNVLLGENEKIQRIIDDINQEDIQSTKYTQKIETPQYVPTGKKPSIQDLINTEKYEQLKKQVQQADIEKDLKNFLLLTATRHIQFNYENIAEFYAHQPAKIQRLMEQQVLIIIDFNDAVEQGYTRFTKNIMEKTQ